MLDQTAMASRRNIAEKALSKRKKKTIAFDCNGLVLLFAEPF